MKAAIVKEEGNVLFLKPEYGDFIEFKIKIIEKGEGYVTGAVEQTASWNMDDEPADFEEYLDFTMKFDGCCHINFGEVDDDETRDGYMHMCGARCWREHLWIMEWLFAWAQEIVPMQIDTSEDLHKLLEYRNPKS